MLSEKAKSRAQQRFFGMVRAAQKGEMDNPSSEVVDAADSMKVDDVKKFAKTKHKGLPEKKKIEEVAFLAAAGKVALAAGKGAVKQKAKQVVKQKAANVAAGAIPQPNRDQQEGVVKSLKKFGEYLAPTPGKGTSNEPSVAAGTRTPKSTHMFKHVPSMNKDGTTGQYGKKGSTAIVQGAGNVAKKFAPTAKTVAKAALPVAGAVGAGLAVSKGVDSLMKLGKKKKVNESKGTAELAALALRGKKRCAECGSFTHVTGDCPKKEHSVKESNKYKGVLTDPMKEAYRVLASSDGQEKPSQFSYKDEKTAKKYADSIKKGGGKATVTKESVLTRLGRKKKVEEKKPSKAMDAGARAKRLLQRKVHAKYVSGSQDLVPDDIRDHYEVSEDYMSGQTGKIQARTLAWMRKKGMKGSPGLDAMKAREAEHKAKRGVKEEVLDELKSTTLLSYSQKAANQLAFKGDGSKKAQKRATGVKRAAGQLTMKAINKEEVEKVQEASAVLDANTKIKNTQDRKKKEKEYVRLMGILAHQKDLKKRGLSSSYESEGEMVEARVDKGRSDYGKATIRNWRHSGPKTVEPAMFDPENKRGKTIDKRRAEHKARRGVKGAKVPTYTKEEKLDELKLFGKKGSGAIFYNDPKGRRDALQTTGKDPGAINKPAVKKAVDTVKTNVTNKVNNVGSTVQKSIDTQTNRAGSNIGNQISRKVKPAVSSGVADGIKKGATSVGKAALAGAGGVGVGLAVSKGVDSAMKGGKKKTNEELSIVDKMLIEFSPKKKVVTSEGKGSAAVTGTLGNIVGGTVGAAVGGPAGAAVGSVAGGALGGAAGGRKGKKKRAAIGGALGSALGPIGSGVGSAIGASRELEGEVIKERLGGKGYKPRKDYAGRRVSGDWEDSDRGAGNKATRRAGGEVKKKSPTYQAYIRNK